MTLPSRSTFVLRTQPRSRRYFAVHVADDHWQLQQTLDRLEIAPNANRIACCVAIHAPVKWKRLIGFLFFSREYLSAAIAMHELAHAGFRALDHAGVKLEHWNNVGHLRDDDSTRYASSAEETYCDIVEHMTRVFWREVYKRELATP